MTDADLLRCLAVDPSALDPAPPWTPCGSAGIERLEGRYPCVRCGQTATVAGVVDAPGHGRRWMDTCMPCLIATAPRGGPSAPLADTLAVLREAAHEAGATVNIVATYCLTLTIGARIIARGWWPDVATADRKFASWINERSSTDGARIILTDETDERHVLNAWPRQD